MTADLHLAAAAETLARLDEIGPDAYGPNAPALIMEAQLRVAYAEAVTNRIRLLTELMQAGAGEAAVAAERSTLIISTITPREDTP